MRFPLDFTLRRLAERQAHDDDGQTPEQVATWCKSTSLTKNGDEIMFPNQGDVWSVGETKGFGWTGGVNVVDGQSQTFSLEIGSEDDTDGSKPVKVFADKTFKYPSSDWQVWNDDCPDTYLSYYWTIPKDFHVGDTRFFARLINTTDPDNKTTLTSSFFYIDSNPAEVALQATSPTEAAASEEITSSPTSATSVSTLVSETTSAPTATLNAVADADVTEVPASSELSAQAKAGIGAGVGILGLMLILIGFFFWWYKKRQNRGIQEKGFVKPALTINTPESPTSDAGQSLKPRMSTGGLSARPRLSEVGSIGSRLSEGRISPRPILSEGRNSPKLRLSESGSARPRLSEGRNSPKSPLSEGRISPRPRVSDGGSSSRPRISREMEDVPGSPLYRTPSERDGHRRSIRIVYEPNQDPLGLPSDASMWSPKNSQDGLNKS
ncbi:hypothetical protein NW768_007351 [Fusarium equiseti]|uniref:Uncharacterized protein n=1 Tax=Fusarium equiseti TaxID=61235 RepID=A0ABQ8R7G9_FUSEQ|nr:hypothetical protein NW768_007351 [Fusarium equiseti]